MSVYSLSCICNVTALEKKCKENCSEGAHRRFPGNREILRLFCGGYTCCCTGAGTESSRAGKVDLLTRSESDNTFLEFSRNGSRVEALLARARSSLLDLFLFFTVLQTRRGILDIARGIFQLYYLCDTVIFIFTRLDTKLL